MIYLYCVELIYFWFYFFAALRTVCDIQQLIFGFFNIVVSFTHVV